MYQLIAHHPVFFIPGSLQVWVSTNPWQLGPYVCYDLYKIFHNFAGLQRKVEISEPGKTIPSDLFLGSMDYRHFLRFREMRKHLIQILRAGKTDTISGSFIDNFRASNPMNYEVFKLIGDNYTRRGQLLLAQTEYRLALSKVIPHWNEKEKIIKKLADCNIRIMK